MQASPIINDKTHDPFIIFGGLFSRKEVTSLIDSYRNEKFENTFQEAIELKKFIINTKISEERLRHKIAKNLLSGVLSHLPKNSQGDIFYQDVVVEVKNYPDDLDVETITGSIKNKALNRKETAVEELFRYLGDGSKNKWGVLTTGRVYRLYHFSSSDQYIEFDLFDILDSGSINHFLLLKALLMDSELRNDLFEKTKKIREIQARNSLFSQLEKVLTSSERSDRSKAYASIVTFLTYVSIRYLEDVGVLPILSSEYRNYSLKDADNYSAENLKNSLSSFVSGKWFNGNKQSLLSKEEQEAIDLKLRDEKFVSRMIKVINEYQNFDYSDIFIDHLGGIYQEIVNKNSEGAYYTPYIIGRKIAAYLKGINENKKIHFEENVSKVIVDIACGSGQLLRALVPYSHLFFKDKKGFLGKNSLRRKLISRLVGIDKDPNSVFICKISLGLFGAEVGLGLSMPRLVKEEDTLEAFCNSRSNFLEIDRKDIFSIVTNPPWESLDFDVSMLYRKLTGNKLPKKSSNSIEAKELRKDFDLWEKNNTKLIELEQKRIDNTKELCEKVSAEHSDYFSGKKNTALYFFFIIQKIIEQSKGTYVVVMPDRFFVGESAPIRDKLFHEFDGYIPFQNCGSIFDGVDKGTRFGIVFGRNKTKKDYGSLYLQIPIIEDLVPKEFITYKIDKSDLMYDQNTILPFFQNVEECSLFNSWFANRTVIDSWSQGRLNLGSRSNSGDYKVGKSGQYKYKVVKSNGRTTSDFEQFAGKLNISFGASIDRVDERLENHYNSKKIIVPNVKRNGIRKVLASIESNCIVEHAYNFNTDLTEKELPLIRSFSYNSLVNCLAGSYNINASLQNQLGLPMFESDEKRVFVYEVELLKSLSFSESDAINILFKSILVKYPKQVKETAIRELQDSYGECMRHMDLSYDEDYRAIISQTELFDTHKAKVLDFEKSKKLSGYIISTLKNDKNFGRVKYAKVLYLTQHLSELDLGIDWQRKAAGPYNEKDLKKIEKTLSHEFGIESEIKKVDGNRYIKYKTTQNLKSKEFISDLEKEKQSIIERWVEWFKPFNTDKMELIATIYAAWNDLLLKGESVTMRKIINEVRNNWAPSKKKYSENRIRTEVNFMKENDIVPRGFGYSTIA